MLQKQTKGSYCCTNKSTYMSYLQVTITSANSDIDTANHLFEKAACFVYFDEAISVVIDPWID